MGGHPGSNADPRTFNGWLGYWQDYKNLYYMFSKFHGETESNSERSTFQKWGGKKIEWKKERKENSES